MNSVSNIALRHRAESRFRFYGKCAIAVALLALTLMIIAIVEHGWRGFLHTEIGLTVTVDSHIVGKTPTEWRHADMSPFIKQALLKEFPQTAEGKPMRDLVGLISSGAIQILRNKIVASPALINTPLTLWLPASDKVERAVKDNVSLKTPETERRISNQQLEWLEKLQQKNLVRSDWNPYFFSAGDSREPELAGFLGSMMGSLLALFACMIVAFPIGVMAAIYLEEFSKKNWRTSFIEININNLAAVPSIVYGLLGLSVYLNLFGITRSATLAGGLTLALMILPTIIIATRASLRAIPDSIRDAARGLGASPLQVVLHHTLPLAVPGIVTGSILGIARAIGETAPLLMIGMVAFIADIPHTLLDPATAMPVQIYLWSTSPEESFVEKTDAAILVLLCILVVINSSAMFIRKHFEHRW